MLNKQPAGSATLLICYLRKISILCCSTPDCLFPTIHPEMLITENSPSSWPKLPKVQPFMHNHVLGFSLRNIWLQVTEKLKNSDLSKQKYTFFSTQCEMQEWVAFILMVTTLWLQLQPSGLHSRGDERLEGVSFCPFSFLFQESETDFSLGFIPQNHNT